MKLLITTTLLALAASAGTAAANPVWATSVKQSTLDQGKRDVIKMLEEDGKDAALADIVMTLDVGTTSASTRCPGLDVDVFNAMDHIAWDVEVEIEQKLGTRESKTKMHLPFLPAKSQARVTVSCLEDYSYSGYGGYGGYGNYGGLGGNDPISYTHGAHSHRKTAEALEDMLHQKLDVDLSGMDLKPATSNQTLMQVVLATDDPAIAKEIVAAIAQTGVGAKELGEAIAKAGNDSPLTAEVAKQLATLPAAQQAKLARALLAAPNATQWADSLGPLIDTKLCSGPRADTVALWAMAQLDNGIPVAELRAKAQAKCTLLPTDAAALITAIDGAPQYARALDKVDAAMFASVVAGWKKGKGVAQSLWSFVADTGDAARFDAAIALIQPDDRPDAILSVAQGKPAAEANDASAHRAKWIADTAVKLPLDAQDTLVRDIFKLLVGGQISDPAMRKAVRDLHGLAPQAADAIVSAKVSEVSKVFDANALTEAKVDLYDYLAFASTSLADCKSTLESLVECAQAIQKRPELVKVAGTALTSDFKSIVDQLMSAAPQEKMVAAAKDLDKAGISVKTQVDNLCTSVRDALHYDTDYETPLAAVKQMPGGDSCVAAIGDEAASKHRTVIIMTILAILGLVLPLPAGWFFLKRRWKKFQAELPKAEEAPAPGARVEDRLGAAGLGNALGLAVGEARREIDLPGLAAIDQAMLERAAATVRRAVKTGDAASLLAKVGGQTVYVLGLPVRNVRPQVVQRYLGTEWPEHLDAVVAAAGAPVTALVVLCDPGATEATLLVGYGDGSGRRSDPDALLDAKEAREKGANTFRGAMSLRVGAK